MTRALNLGSMSTRYRRIAEIARNHKDEALQTLAHFIDIHWLYEAWAKTKKKSAEGVDRMTAAEYEGKLNDNLDFLLERLKSGEYFAPPVRRGYVPKGDGKELRPIGMPTFEDKILQRAIQMVLEPVYEPMFYDFSFGFRPGRGQHQALESIRETLMDFRGGWVLSVDIKGYFDTIGHKNLRRFLDRRVRDGVIRRTIDKWLSAGVMENGVVHVDDVGSPQGGVISPMISNIYLHYVLDEWMVKKVMPLMDGKVDLIRWADDFLIVFEQEIDARKVMKAVDMRFAKYGLTVHPEKTKLIDFRRPVTGGKSPRGNKPGSVDFLGFTLHWGKSRSGYWVVRRKTAKSRLKRSIRKVGKWQRENRSMKIPEQWKALCLKMEGHYQYFGVTGNYDSLGKFFQKVRRSWFYWLKRRSQRSKMTWERFCRILGHLPLPKPHIPKSVYRL